MFKYADCQPILFLKNTSKCIEDSHKTNHCYESIDKGCVGKRGTLGMLKNQDNP